MKRGKRQREWMGWLKGALIMPCLALLGDGSALQAQGPRDGESRTVRGTIESLTTAPKGETDGAVLENGTVLHWPPHLEGRFAGLAKKGDRVTAVGLMRTGPKGDTRLEVRKLTNRDTDATAENDERGARPKRRKGPPPHERRAGPLQTIRGTVERMTTAPKGEVDGAALDDGTVIHWPPHLEDRFASVVTMGDRVEVTGFEDTGKRGKERFEVQSLTNLRTDRSVENDDVGRPPPREARRGDRDGATSRSERIRQLKEEAERLQREIERLEREP